MNESRYDFEILLIDRDCRYELILLIEDVIVIFISTEKLFEGVVFQKSGNNSYLQGLPSDSGTVKLGIPACSGIAKGIEIRTSR